MLTMSRPARQFDPERKSIWADESPIAADGVLLDLWNDALGEALHGLDQLNDARRSSAEYTDRDLEHAEKAFRDALAKIASLRQRVASVPSDFGRDA